MHPVPKPKRTLRLATSLTVGLAFLLTSCGTLLYPERRGQPVGRLDPGVVVLDGVGLLLFIVPGALAFIVDFATGAIYLPPEYVAYSPPGVAGLCRVRVDPADLTPKRLEAVVRDQTGKSVSLQPGAYRARPLRTLDEFTPEAVAAVQSGPGTERVIFRACGD